MAMRRLRIPIVDLSASEKSYLDADYTAGTALTVVNNYGFELNDIAIVGEGGEEKSESQTVTGQTGHNTVNITTALKFTHNKNCVVYRFEYDQIEIYRYRAAVWSLISTSNIQWDKKETLYVDDTSLGGDLYKFRYKNSLSLAVSDYSPTLSAGGLASDTAGFAIREIRKIVDPERQIVSDAELIRQFNRLKEYIQGMRENWWFLLVDTYKAGVGIPTVANTDTYSLATYTDLNSVSVLRYKYNDGVTLNVYNLTYEPKIVLEYNQRDVDINNNDDWAEQYTLLPADATSPQGYIRIWPTSKTAAYGTFYPDYYKKMAAMDDITDSLEVPNPQIFIDYGLGYVYRIMGEDTKARAYGDENSGYVKKGLEILIKQDDSKKRATGQPRSLKTGRGRKAISRLYGNHGVDRDYLAETYF